MPDEKENRPATVEEGGSLGQLLLREGLITRSQLSEALAVQERERNLYHRQLVACMLKENLLSVSDLVGVVSALGFEKELVRRLVQEKRVDRALYQRLTETGDEPLLVKLLNRRIVSVRELVTRYGLGGSLEEACKRGMVPRAVAAQVKKRCRSPRMLGEILVSEGHVSPIDLSYILDKHAKRKQLGDLLVEEEYLTSDQLMGLLRERGRSPVPLGQYLVQKGLITRSTLLEMLARQYNLKVVELNDLDLKSATLQSLRSVMKAAYARLNGVLPVRMEGAQLTLALNDPRVLQREVNADYGGYRVHYVLVSERDFHALFRLLYGEDWKSEGDAKPRIQVDVLEMKLEEQIQPASGACTMEDAQDVEAHEMVNRILIHGLELGASDIHIEQDYESVKLRYRVDGVLGEPLETWMVGQLQEKVHAVVSRIKIMCNLDIAERRLPQDGSFRMSYLDRTRHSKAMVDFRVAVCRANVGENVVIRILDSRKSGVGLDELNISADLLTEFKRLLRQPAGIILVTGPTGSGKSTTLYAALQRVHNPGIKIITAEDPVEYNFPGVMQTQVHPKIGLDFPRLLRSFLRLDPDVILVGEIRDRETAQIAFDAAQTGHLLLSTLHTNDSFGTLVRLRDLGIEYGQISASLKGVLAQRLVRFTCPQCRHEYRPKEEEWGPIFLEYPENITFQRGTGCTACRYTGYRGRGCLCELLVVDQPMQSLITRGADLETIRENAFENGMLNMVEDAVRKLDRTTLGEILRVAPFDMIEMFRAKQKALGPAAVENLIGAGLESFPRIQNS